MAQSPDDKRRKIINFLKDVGATTLYWTSKSTEQNIIQNVRTLLKPFAKEQFRKRQEEKIPQNFMDSVPSRLPNRN